MNPACAIDEYASIRFTSRCAIATIDPSTTDSTASTSTSGTQSHASGWNPTRNTRMNAKKAAVFVAADMNAVTGVGAPWYTSGVHMWNGAAETLNANPIASRTIANSAIASDPVPPASASRHRR